MTKEHNEMSTIEHYLFLCMLLLCFLSVGRMWIVPLLVVKQVKSCEFREERPMFSCSIRKYSALKKKDCWVVTFHSSFYIGFSSSTAMFECCLLLVRASFNLIRQTVWQCLTCAASFMFFEVLKPRGKKDLFKHKILHNKSRKIKVSLVRGQ